LLIIVHNYEWKYLHAENMSIVESQNKRHADSELGRAQV